MKNKKTNKLSSAVGCISGLLCAFFTGMFLASGSLSSLPALFMGITTVVFIISIISYLVSSK